MLAPTVGVYGGMTVGRLSVSISHLPRKHSPQGARVLRLAIAPAPVPVPAPIRTSLEWRFASSA